MSIIKAAGAALIVVIGATSFAVAGTDTSYPSNDFNAPAARTQGTFAPSLYQGRSVYIAPTPAGQPVQNSQNGDDNAPGR